MGLQRVPLLTEVLLVFIKVLGFWSGSVALIIEAESCGVLPAVSRRAGSKTRPDRRPRAGEPRAGVLPPGNLRRFGSCSHAAASAACQWPVLSFGFGITTVITSQVIMRGGLAFVSDVSHHSSHDPLWQLPWWHTMRKLVTETSGVTP
jgi:hypothetical protein